MANKLTDEQVLEFRANATVLSTADWDECRQEAKRVADALLDARERIVELTSERDQTRAALRVAADDAVQAWRSSGWPADGHEPLRMSINEAARFTERLQAYACAAAKQESE